MNVANIRANEAVEEIAATAVSVSKQTLIAISGLTCSGKTFLANLLADHLQEKYSGSSVLRQDKYFRDMDDPELPRTESGAPIFDSPHSFHNDEFTTHVFMLLRGQPIRMPQYEVATNKRRLDSFEPVEPNPVVEAEGLYTIRLLHRIHSPVIAVYVDTPVEICLERRIRRDEELYGIPRERVEKNFREIVLPHFRKHLEPQKQLANFVVI